MMCLSKSPKLFNELLFPIRLIFKGLTVNTILQAVLNVL